MTVTSLPLFSKPLSDILAKQPKEKEELRIIYGYFLDDIPSEKEVFDLKKGGIEERLVYDDPEILKWIAFRIKEFRTNANREMLQALGSMIDRVVDLSSKSLVDVTIKDFYPLEKINKLVLSGNFLKSLPSICYLKPYLSLEAKGNHHNLEAIFDAFKQENKLSYDLLYLFKAASQNEIKYHEEYNTLLEMIRLNPAKLAIPMLAHLADKLMTSKKPTARYLEVCSRWEGGKREGGIRGWVDFTRFLDLEFLDLSGCLFDSLEAFEGLDTLKKLKGLNLSRTSLIEFPSVLERSSIERLDISSTRITALPLWLCNMKKLKILDASDTGLIFIHSSIGRMGLKTCILDGTFIETLPYFNDEIKVLSLKRTRVSEISKEMIPFFKQNKIRWDESNLDKFKFQARLYACFYFPHVASLVFHAEAYKKQNQGIPLPIKTGVVGLKYISIISFLMLWQFFDTLIISTSAPCRIKKAPAMYMIPPFSSQKIIVYMIVFFNLFSSVLKRWSDIKEVSRFIVK